MKEIKENDKVEVKLWSSFGKNSKSIKAKGIIKKKMDSNFGGTYIVTEAKLEDFVSRKVKVIK